MDRSESRNCQLFVVHRDIEAVFRNLQLLVLEVAPDTSMEAGSKCMISKRLTRGGLANCYRHLQLKVPKVLAMGKKLLKLS